jgi:predicted regulator of Ras-like GTPase activity (Roadblock/LC7/MglB family)
MRFLDHCETRITGSRKGKRFIANEKGLYNCISLDFSIQVTREFDNKARKRFCPVNSVGEEAALLDFRAIQDILASLPNDCPGISGSAVLTKDGLPIASVILPQGVDEAIVAAVSASILTSGKIAASELKHRGGVTRVVVETENGMIVVQGIPDAEAVLTITAEKDTKMGLIFLAMDRSIRKLKVELTRFMSEGTRLPK